MSISELNMNTLKTIFIQSDLSWENPEANRNYFKTKINKITTDVDLIILPEMFTTGFSMNAVSLAEEMEGETVAWIRQIAEEKNVAIMGSMIIKESFDSAQDSTFNSDNDNNSFYNRLLFVFPSGEIQYYDKRHTFTLAKEHETYTSGNKKLIIAYKGWKICPLICYDLRFPAWARNQEEYDLLIYVASWPKIRISAWNALLKARAIENMSYTIGVNRIGLDGNKYEYVGHSVAYDALGNALSKEFNENECVISVDLQKEEQNSIRKKLGFLKDRDVFKFS